MPSQQAAAEPFEEAAAMAAELVEVRVVQAMTSHVVVLQDLLLLASLFYREYSSHSILRATHISLLKVAVKI
jgi:hypothetical protein